MSSCYEASTAFGADADAAVERGFLRQVFAWTLIGLVVASVAFIFTGGGTFNLIIGFGGVLIFSGLTAYDLQRLKAKRAQGFANAQTVEKLAIFGALRL